MGNDNPRRQRHRQPQQQWHPPRPSAAASPSAQTRDTYELPPKTVQPVSPLGGSQSCYLLLESETTIEDGLNGLTLLAGYRKQRHALSSRVSADPRERLASAPSSFGR